MNKNIQVEELHIGKNSIIESSVKIRGINGKAKKIVIGDNCYIGDNAQIICDDFSIGDYAKIHHDANIHGYLPCHIGHNAWIGQFTIIDSIGGVTIGNNCGIGAHSQLWSHIKFGDTLEGCNFLSDKPMHIGNDVWFVGHCIVSPVHAHDKSMAMAGAVITNDMNYNEIYAGVPAISISDKIGFQFSEKSIEEKFAKMAAYLKEWNANSDKIKIVKSLDEIDFDSVGISYFNIADRTYTKKSTAEEIAFMKFLLPARAKFVPLKNQ